jgi:hypothetical protein
MQWNAHRCGDLTWPEALDAKIGRMAAATPPLLDVVASAGCWRTVKGPVATLEGEEAM